MSFEYKLEVIHTVFLLCFISGRLLTPENSETEEELFCKCMDYWECLTIGGQLYSYCVFSNEVCCISNDTINFETSLKIENKNSLCGKKELDSGRENFAEFGEWGWHVAILIANKDVYICGGSLIDEKWVLTAAHCVDNLEPQTLKVRVGEYDVSTTKEPERHEEFDVKQVLLHQDFNNNTLLNDIALLELKTITKKRSNVNIVCLPRQQVFTKELLMNTKCFITGWGKTNEKSDYSPVLKEVLVPLWNRSHCQNSLRAHFGSNYSLPKTVICGGDVGQDACDGDGGGGLFCEFDGLWYEIGIISFGIGCGRKDSPGVYTNVMHYLDWIYDITSQPLLIN